MSSRQHSPLVIVEGQGSRVLQPVTLRANGASSGYDEAWVRDLVLANPTSIPVHEIDPAFGPLIPICRELDTRIAGPADAFFINPLGMPTLVECKLWRNPEARREVVGQILDYARVLKRWSYTDLQQQAARARNERGFNLAEFVRAQVGADFDEAAFCDNVTRNLSRGRILLLILGDGIREGVESIAEYVQGSPGLHFTLGLVEMQVFEVGPDVRIVQPRVLARTVIVNRTVVDLARPELEIQDADLDDVALPQAPRDLDERQSYMLGFWTDLLATLKLDDSSQQMAKPLAGSNIYFPMPIRQLWVTCYFSQKSNNIGVFLGWHRISELAAEIIGRLEEAKAEIDEDFGKAGLKTSWNLEGGKIHITASKHYPVLRDPACRDDQLEWFRNTINAYVNVLRPRIAAMMSDSQPLA